MVFAISDPLGGPGKVEGCGSSRRQAGAGRGRSSSWVRWSYSSGWSRCSWGPPCLWETAAAATDPLTRAGHQATRRSSWPATRRSPAGTASRTVPTPVTTVLGNPECRPSRARRRAGGRTHGGPTSWARGRGGTWRLPGQPAGPGLHLRPVASALRPRGCSPLSTPDWPPTRSTRARWRLQYWFFYTFNDWNDKHEGDWEMVQVVLPAASAEEALGVTPESVAFAQHEGSQVSPWDGGGLIKVGDFRTGDVYPAAGFTCGLLHASHLVRQERGCGVRVRQHDCPGGDTEPRR